MNFSKAVGSRKLSKSDDVTLSSSSLPVLPDEKLILNNDENDYHQSIETNDLLKGLEDHAIGSLLPDEDDLLAGGMDNFDLNLIPNHVDDSEDLDLFGSGGGMELEPDMLDNLNFRMSKVSLGDGAVANGGAVYNAGTVAGEHPYGEHPSRTLFVRNINSNVEDSELQTLFEQYGDIRTLYTACKHRGFVMISYYDIRAARTAMRALQNKPLRRRKLDIHFSIPKDNPSDKDINQGTLVVFNLDPSVSCEDLLQIFGAYGEVKEIRETPYKRHHKFIEYYDVRAAEAALRSLNRSDIAGRRIKLEPSRPGGARRNLMLQLSHEFDQDDARGFRLQVSPSIANSPPGVWARFGSPIEYSPLQSLTRSPVFTSLSPTSSPGLVSILHPQPARITPIGKDHKSSHTNRSTPAFGASGSTTSGIETLSGPQFLWGSPDRPSHGFPTTGQSPTTDHPFTGQLNPFLCSSQQLRHVGSAPSGLSFDQHFSQNHEPPETLFTIPPTFGSLGLGQIDRGFLNGRGSPSFSNMSPMMSHMFLDNENYLGLGSLNLDSTSQWPGNRWIDHHANPMDNNKQFQLDLDKICNGEDTRTTLMIKNIPNNYTSKMLLAVINEYHSGTYDFLYLPIDLKNKCNVGYAFINMLSPIHIIPFYQVFNGKKWDKFNSEKIALLAYARIQGKAALVTHFQNSSLMNEDKQCRPILFQSEGFDVVDQEHLPTSSLNIRVHPYSGDPWASPLDDGNC